MNGPYRLYIVLGGMVSRTVIPVRTDRRRNKEKFRPGTRLQLPVRKFCSYGAGAHMTHSWLRIPAHLGLHTYCPIHHTFLNYFMYVHSTVRTTIHTLLFNIPLSVCFFKILNIHIVIAFLSMIYYYLNLDISCQIPSLLLLKKGGSFIHLMKMGTGLGACPALNMLVQQRKE